MALRHCYAITQLKQIVLGKDFEGGGWLLLILTVEGIRELKDIHLKKVPYCYLINIWSRGVFKGPYNSTCRVLNFWFPTVGCWIIEKFVFLPQNLLVFHQNGQICLPFRIKHKTPSCWLAIDMVLISLKSRVLICSIKYARNKGNDQIHACKVTLIVCTDRMRRQFQLFKNRLWGDEAKRDHGC